MHDQPHLGFHNDREVLEEAARGTLAITSLAEESRPPAALGGDQH
jgi:hypothetical protein